MGARTRAPAGPRTLHGALSAPGIAAGFYIYAAAPAAFFTGFYPEPYLCPPLGTFGRADQCLPVVRANGVTKVPMEAYRYGTLA